MSKLRVNMVSESEVSVQGHGVHTAYTEMVNALKKRRDIDVITGEFGSQVECDIVHLHTVGPRTYKKIFQKNVKKVMSAHVVPDSFVGSLVGARLWKGIATRYLRWFYNKADLLVAVSPATATELRKMGVRSPVTIIENSIDTERYSPVATDKRANLREKLELSESAFVVIGAGQVQPRKRVDRFIAAAKALPDIQFVWVGGMPFGRIAADYNAMQAMMRATPKNVHFPGIVPLEDMPSYYQLADAFWLPSVQETFGLVVIEAAASGLPIVLRDIPDYDDTFADFAVMVDDENDSAMIARLASDQSFVRCLSNKIC